MLMSKKKKNAKETQATTTFLPIEKISKEVRLWMKGKTISKVRVVRPTIEEEEMYEVMLGPMALKIFFTDGSNVILDTWIGEFRLKKSAISKTPFDRPRSYFTVTRNEEIDL